MNSPENEQADAKDDEQPKAHKRMTSPVQWRRIIMRIYDLFTIPADAPPMPGRMKVGLLALWLLMGFIVFVFCMNLLYLFFDKNPGYAALLIFLVLIFVAPIPLPLLICLLRIQRGRKDRTAAIFCLCVPVFLFLPPITELIFVSFELFLPLLGIHKNSDSLFWFLEWTIRPFLVAVLIAAAPLAFGARAKEWYQLCRQKKGIALPEKRVEKAPESVACANDDAPPLHKSGASPVAPQDADVP
jgi:hypothetical protein